jgi:hypothetical protein
MPRAVTPDSPRRSVLGSKWEPFVARAPLVFALVIDHLGDRVLIVSSALSSAALAALFYSDATRRGVRRGGVSLGPHQD